MQDIGADEMSSFKNTFAKFWSSLRVIRNAIARINLRRFIVLTINGPLDCVQQFQEVQCLRYRAFISLVGCVL